MLSFDTERSTGEYPGADATGTPPVEPEPIHDRASPIGFSTSMTDESRPDDPERPPYDEQDPEDESDSAAEPDGSDGSSDGSDAPEGQGNGGDETTDDEEEERRQDRERRRGGGEPAEPGEGET